MSPLRSPWPALALALGTLIWFPAGATLADEPPDSLGHATDVAVAEDGASVFFHGEVPRDTVRVVATVEGPRRTVLGGVWLRRLLGLWLPTQGYHFAGVPSFYQISASCPSCNALSQCEHRLDLHRLNELVAPFHLTLGRAWIRSTVSVEKPAAPLTTDQVLDELWRRAVATGSYRIRENSIRINAQSVFYHLLEIPDSAPEGTYRVVTAFLANDRAIEVRRNEFVLRRSGFNAWLLRMSSEWSWLYGLIVALLALSAGWLTADRGPRERGER